MTSLPPHDLTFKKKKSTQHLEVGLTPRVSVHLYHWSQWLLLSATVATVRSDKRHSEALKV